MTPIDPNHEDALGDLVGSVKARRREEKRSADATQISGLKPSEILFLPREQQKLINYLSRQRYANFLEIQQFMGVDQPQTQQLLSLCKDAGYVHEALRGGEIFYRVKFVDSSVQLNNNLPKELWSTLSLDNVAFLRQLPLFKDLAGAALDHISQCFKQEHYARNDIVVQQGGQARSFFVIKSGVVALSNLSSSGAYNFIGYLEQGDFFGESGLLTGQSISATITAFTPVDILVMNKDDFYAMLSKHFEIAIELARTLAYRLSATNTRLANKLDASCLFLVVSTDRHLGAATVANAMALMVAASAKEPTAYIEFSDKDLSSIYGFPPASEKYDHPGGFQILDPKRGADIPELAQVTLVMDQASTQYKNIIICVPGELARQLDTLVRSAAQIAVVTSSQRKDREHAQKVIASLKPYIRTNKTRLFTIVNHTAPDVLDDVVEPPPDFVIPFLSHLPVISERRVENLPEPLSEVVMEMFKLLGYSSQIGVYLPTTIGVDQHVDTTHHVEKTLSFMGKVFGGATHEKVQGVWNSQDAGLVEEDIHVVRSYCSQPILDQHMGEVVDYVEALKQELQQEAMALEVNQKLMLI